VCAYISLILISYAFCSWTQQREADESRAEAKAVGDKLDEASKALSEKDSEMSAAHAATSEAVKALRKEAGEWRERAEVSTSKSS
jgi:hypothetical protein